MRMSVRLPPTPWLLTAVWSCWPAVTPAQQPASANSLGEITVTGRKILNDDALSTEVAAALHSDAYLDDAHVTVTTKDGVVTLHGFVQDAWDLLALRRVAKKVAGSKKVVNDVELMLNDQ